MVSGPMCALAEVIAARSDPNPLSLRLVTYTVTNLNDSGLGSLRAAITSANAHMGPDTIVFTVAGTINVLTQLPDLSPSGTTIDRTTAPSYAGAPVVALRGLG